MPPSDVLNVNPLELQDLSETSALSEDGYRYKTVRKLRKYRHRRDVSEIPTAEYLPPLDVVEIAPLADDGYHYKTVRKLKYRHRRDVNEIPIPFPSNFNFAANFPEEAGVVPVDESGYKYRTVRRLRHRKRRAAIDLPTGEYLPQDEEAAAPEVSSMSEEATASHKLDDDGYRYKTVRKLKYRNRRDVAEDLERE